jgi:hypothetical protein
MLGGRSPRANASTSARRTLGWAVGWSLTTSSEPAEIIFLIVSTLTPQEGGGGGPIQQLQVLVDALLIGFNFFVSAVFAAYSSRRNRRSAQPCGWPLCGKAGFLAQPRDS